ncbi:MFS transporter, partial [Escherichia coli]|uniref:MFS transporter n=1 Tax=Escherichia coli TaxID=562 RepID=UPI00207D3588
SDRIGRKPLIVGGLLIFVLGSVIAALTDSIWGIILGRALQGSGAIAAGYKTTAFLLDDDVLIDAGTGVGDLPLDALAAIDHIL